MTKQRNQNMKQQEGCWNLNQTGQTDRHSNRDLDKKC